MRVNIVVYLTAIADSRRNTDCLPGYVSTPVQTHSAEYRTTRYARDAHALFNLLSRGLLFTKIFYLYACNFFGMIRIKFSKSKLNGISESKVRQNYRSLIFAERYIQLRLNNVRRWMLSANAKIFSCVFLARFFSSRCIGVYGRRFHHDLASIVMLQLAQNTTQIRIIAQTERLTAFYIFNRRFISIKCIEYIIPLNSLSRVKEICNAFHTGRWPVFGSRLW